MRLDAIARRAIRLVHTALGVLFFAGLGLSFVNVVMRFVAMAPIPWAEEVLAHWLIWSVCIGSFLVTRERQHLCMDLLLPSLPVPIRSALLALGDLSVLAVSILMVVESWTIIAMTIQFRQRTMVSGIPLAIPYSALLVGFALMIIAVISRFARKPS